MDIGISGQIDTFHGRIALQYVVGSEYNTKTLEFEKINLKCDVRFLSFKPAKHYVVHHVQYGIIFSDK